MINTLLFVSVCINLILFLLIGFILGQKLRREKADPEIEAFRKIWNQVVGELGSKTAKKGG